MSDDDPTDGSHGRADSDGDLATDVQDVEDLLSEFDEPDGDLDDLFDEVAAEDVDAGAVWAELEGAAPAAGTAGPDDAGDVEDPLDDAVLGEGPGDEAIVAKASYCQGCEHFSSPPDVDCDNPGTQIVDLVDVKHLRVRNCPVVARRRGATVSNLEDGDVGVDGRAAGVDGSASGVDGGTSGDDGTDPGDDGGAGEGIDGTADGDGPGDDDPSASGRDPLDRDGDDRG